MSVLKCSDCEGDLNHVYSEDEIKKALSESELKGFLLQMYELDLRKLFRCDKCGEITELSAHQIVQGFVTKGVREGKTPEELAEEVKTVKDEAKEIIQPCQVCNAEMNYSYLDGFWKCPECGFENID